MSGCYRIDGDRLIPTDTAQIGRAHFLVAHPEQISQGTKSPGAWQFAYDLGVRYIVPTDMRSAVDDATILDGIMANVSDGGG